MSRLQRRKDGDLHVTISHCKRRKISLAKQAAASIGKTCVYIPKYIDESYKCFVGTRIVGSTTHGKFVNQARYTVTAVSQDKITLKDELTQNEFSTTPGEIASSSRLAWACTYNSTQGSTEQGTVILHDLDNRHLTRAHLYV